MEQSHDAALAGLHEEVEGHVLTKGCNRLLLLKYEPSQVPQVLLVVFLLADVVVRLRAPREMAMGAPTSKPLVQSHVGGGGDSLPLPFPFPFFPLPFPLVIG